MSKAAELYLRIKRNTRLLKSTVPLSHAAMVTALVEPFAFVKPKTKIIVRNGVTVFETTNRCEKYYIRKLNYEMGTY